MSGNDTQDITITAQCLCKAHSFTASVPRASLPLKASCCHCSSCRHATGALFSSDTPWLGSEDEIHNSSLAKYDFSKNVTILFCSTCSTPMFLHEHFAGEDKTIGVFTGALSNNPIPGLVQIRDHIFVGDTIDGGASMWLRKPNADGTLARRWMAARNKSEEASHNWPPASQLPKATEKAGPDEVPIRCHCKGVDFVLRRGDADFANQRREDLPWFVDPETHKLMASFDVCDSCRLHSGIDIFNWTFTLLKYIDFPGSRGDNGFPKTTSDLKTAVSTQENRDPRLGTLAFYASSPDVQRYFCSHCSATVLYAVDDRHDMVDLAIGLLDSPDGARAESILSWGFGGLAEWRQDVMGGWREGLVKAVEAEAETWRIERGYPKNWLRVAKEEAEKAGKVSN